MSGKSDFNYSSHLTMGCMPLSRDVIQKGLNKAHNQGVFGILATNVISLAMLCAFIPIQIMNGPVFAAVLLTSLGSAVVHKKLIKQFGWKWLNNFIMADSLIIAMASSLLWLKIFS